ncbi:MAG: glutathione S-transferase [Pseudomonadota bacterium]
MKIYDIANFPNPVRVRIALAEKAALDDVEFVSVDVMNGEHREAAFLAKNPGGTVPVLELADGTTVSECTAITEYIDHSFDGPTLTGRSPKERAVVHMMQRRAESQLLDAVGAYFHHATPGLGPELERNQNAAWGEAQKSVALAAMHYLNSVLETSPYVAGDAFSMADITAFAGLAFADFAKVEIPAEYTHLLAWRARMTERPAVARALAA